MTRIQLDLPPSIEDALRQVAERDGVSTQQLILTAVTEKLAALERADFLEELASRGSRERFGEILDRVPAREPVKGDELPDHLRKDRRPTP